MPKVHLHDFIGLKGHPCIIYLPPPRHPTRQTVFVCPYSFYASRVTCVCGGGEDCVRECGGASGARARGASGTKPVGRGVSSGPRVSIDPHSYYCLLLPSPFSPPFLLFTQPVMLP
jgi:hypothetical protein